MEKSGGGNLEFVNEIRFPVSKGPELERLRERETERVAISQGFIGAKKISYRANPEKSGGFGRSRVSFDAILR
jgi:hypothetical protein